MVSAGLEDPVKSQIFLHIKIVTIMYEYRKVTEALGNKIAITSYPWTVWSLLSNLTPFSK